MDLSNLLSLVEDVFSGPREEESRRLVEQLEHLQSCLQAASKSELSAVEAKINELREDGYIPSEDMPEIQAYFSSIAAGKPPPALRLFYLQGPISHPKARNAQVLCSFVYFLQSKISQSRTNALRNLSEHHWKQTVQDNAADHEQKEKFDKCKQIVRVAKSNHFKAMMIAFNAWKSPRSKARNAQQITPETIRNQHLTKAIKELFEKIPVEFEQMAIWKWKLKVEDGMRARRNFISSSKKLDHLLFNKLMNTVIKKWKDRVLWNKERFRMKIHQALRVSFLKCFSSKKDLFTFWKDEVFKEKALELQRQRDFGLIGMINHCSELIKIPLKQGFVRIKRDDSVLRSRLIRALQNGGAGKLRHAFFIWNHASLKRKADLLDRIQKAKGLQSALQSLPNMHFRVAITRLTKGINVVKNAVRNLDKKIKAKVRQSFYNWKDFSVSVKTGKLLENLRAHRLEKELSSITSRTLADSYKRVLGNGRLVKGALLNLDSRLKALPKSALDKWKSFADSIYFGRLMTNLRAEKLKSSLGIIPKRKLKDAFWRVLGEGDKITGALRDLDHRFKNIPRQALAIWKEFASKIKTGLLLDNLKAKSLENTLSKLPVRILKDTLQRVLGEGDKVLGAIKDLENSLRKLPKEAIQKWKEYVEEIKKGHLLDNLRAQKLKHAMGQIPMRKINDALQRIFGQGHKVAGALKELESKIKGIPREALSKWREFVKNIKERRLLDNVRAQQLKLTLKSIPARSMRDALLRTLGQGNTIYAMLKILQKKVGQIPRDALNKWREYAIIRKYEQSTREKTAKIQKMKNALGKPVRRKIRSANRLTKPVPNAADRIKDTIRCFEKIPHEALQIWKNYVVKVQTGEILDNLRAQRLDKVLKNIPNRSLKYATQKIIGEGDIVLGYLKNLENKIKQVPRDALKQWKDYVHKVQKGEILDGLRAQKLSLTMMRIPCRVLKDSTQRIVGNGHLVVGVLKNMESHLKKIPRDALNKWKIFSEKVKTGMILDRLNGQKLQNLMTSIPVRVLKDSVQRVIGGGNKIAGLIRNLINTFEKIPKDALKTWRDYVNKIKEGKLLDSLRVSQLTNSMNRIPSRVLKDALQRLIGQGNKFRGVLKDLETRIQNLPRSALKQWRDFVEKVKSGKMLDNIRAQAIKNSLAQISARSIKDSFQRVIGQGNIIKGKLKELELRLKSIPREALKQWKTYCEKVKTGQILDSLRAQKLNFVFNKIPNRTIKSAIQRLVGEGDLLKGALKQLQTKIQRIPKEALDQWKNYKAFIEKGMILDNIRAERLRLKLGKIPVRSLKDAYERVIGNGDKVLGMLKNLERQLQKRPKDALAKWKLYVQHVLRGQVLDNLRAQKLDKTLFSIPIRTLKGAISRLIGQGILVKGVLRSLERKTRQLPREALQLWRKYSEFVEKGRILNSLRGRELKMILMGIPSRMLKDASKRIMGEGLLVKGVLKNLESKIKNIPREALKRWRDYVVQIQSGKMLDNIRALAIKSSLFKLSARTVRSSFQRLIGQGNLVQGMLKELENKLKNLPREALHQWKRYVNSVKTGAILDNLRAQRLQITLNAIPSRVLRNSVQRLIGQGDIIRGSLKRLENKLKDIPRDCMRKWKLYVQKVRTGAILDSLRAYKLQMSLGKIPVRSLKDVFQRVIGDGHKVTGMLKSLEQQLKRRPKDALNVWKNYAEKVARGMILDRFRAEKLKATLDKIPNRALKDACSRVVGNGDLVTGMLKNMENKIRKIPRDALYQWRKFVERANTGRILDNLRAQHLRFTLATIPLRTLRDTLQRVIGQGDKVAGKLKDLLSQVERIPREALRKWKDYVIQIKTGKILDNLRAQQLRAALSQIPNRMIKNAYQRVIGQGNMILGRLKNLEFRLKQLPRQALSKWRVYASNVKTGQILGNLRASKLTFSLSRIPLRVLKDASHRMIGQGNLVLGKLKLLEDKIRSLPRQALQLWKAFAHSVKVGQILDNLRGEKLRLSLSSIPLRSLKNAMGKILGNGNIVAGYLSKLEFKIKQRPKEALGIWRVYSQKVKAGQILDNLRAQQLTQVLRSIPLRVSKDAYQRVLGQGDRFKAALKELEARIKQVPREALNVWKTYVHRVNTGAMLDSLRAQQLKHSLTKLTLRSLKDTLRRIIGQGNLVAGAFKNLELRAQNMTREALSQWKHFNVQCKQNKVLDQMRGLHLRNALSRIPTRVVKYTYQRIIGQGDRIKGALADLFRRYKMLLADGFAHWKTQAIEMRRGKVLNALRSLNLRQSLERLCKPSLRSAFNSIFSTQDIINNVLKQIYMFCVNRPREALAIWREYVQKCKEGKLLDAIRVQKLKSSLGFLTLRTLKLSFSTIIKDRSYASRLLKRLLCIYEKKPLSCWNLWKKALVTHKTVEEYKENLSKANKLKTSLSKPTRKRIQAARRQTKAVPATDKIKLLAQKVEQRPRQAFSTWLEFVNKVRIGEVLDNVRAHKLNLALKHIPSQTLQSALKRLVGGQKYLVKARLQTLDRQLKNMQGNALHIWKQAVQDIHMGKILDNVRAERLKSQLSSIPARVCKDALLRVHGQGNKIKGALKDIQAKLAQIPRDALHQWKLYVKYVRERKLLDAIKAQELKSCLSIIPKRLLKEACRRIGGDQNKFKAALRRVFMSYYKQTAEAFSLWRSFNQSVNSKGILDNMRARELKIALQSLPVRSVKDALGRVLGQGNIIKAALKRMENSAQRMPKDALEQWKRYLQGLKDRRFLDNLRAQQLRSVLGDIPKRTIRDSFQRFIGMGDQVKGALRRVYLAMFKVLPDSFSTWKKYVKDINEKRLLDGVRSRDLRIALDKVSNRSLRTAFRLSVGIDTIIASKLRFISLRTQKLQKECLDRWKKTVDMIRQGQLLDLVAGEKLRKHLMKLAVNPLNSAFGRITNYTNFVRDTLKKMFLKSQFRLKDSFTRWKNRHDVQDKLKLYKRIVLLFCKMCEKTEFDVLYCFKTWALDIGKLRRRVAARLTQNLRSNQNLGIQSLKESVKRLKLIDKIKGSMLLQNKIIKMAERSIARRFKKWKAMEEDRIIKLKKRVVNNMLFNQPFIVSVQASFWRWKLAPKMEYKATLKQKSAFNKVLHVVNSHTYRLQNSAFCKLVLSCRSLAKLPNKVQLQLAVASLVNAQRESPNVSISSVEALAQDSTWTPSGLSMDEFRIVNQMTSVEILGLSLKRSHTRNISSSFTAIKSYSNFRAVVEEGTNKMNEHIMKLRDDKKNLIEDNQELREQNEALIHNLELTNNSYEELSLCVDQLKLGKIVTILGKKTDRFAVEALIKMSL